MSQKENEIDFISNPKHLVECLPKFEDTMEAIRDHRSQLEEIRRISSARRAVGMTPGGTMMKVACFPQELYAAIVEINPWFLKDKKEFYAWLNKNPYYRVGGIIEFS